MSHSNTPPLRNRASLTTRSSSLRRRIPVAVGWISKGSRLILGCRVLQSWSFYLICISMHCCDVPIGYPFTPKPLPYLDCCFIVSYMLPVLCCKYFTSKFVDITVATWRQMSSSTVHTVERFSAPVCHVVLHSTASTTLLCSSFTPWFFCTSSWCGRFADIEHIVRGFGCIVHNLVMLA